MTNKTIGLAALIAITASIGMFANPAYAEGNGEPMFIMGELEPGDTAIHNYFVPEDSGQFVSSLMINEIDAATEPIEFVAIDPLGGINICPVTPSNLIVFIAECSFLDPMDGNWELTVQREMEILDMPVGYTIATDTALVPVFPADPTS